MEPSIAFTQGFNTSIFITEVALAVFSFGWFGQALIGAGWAFKELKTMGRSPWGWTIGILIGGSVAFPLFLMKVKGYKRVAIAFWALLVIAPVFLFVWSSEKRYRAMSVLEETHDIVPVTP